MATHPGQGFDWAPGLTGDLRDLPVLRLDIGLGEQISVDPAELRARYFAVRGPAPIIVENIEENELLDAASVGTVACLVLAAAVLVSAFPDGGFPFGIGSPGERTEGPGLPLTEQIYRR